MGFLANGPLGTTGAVPGKHTGSDARFAKPRRAPIVGRPTVLAIILGIIVARSPTCSNVPALGSDEFRLAQCSQTCFLGK